MSCYDYALIGARNLQPNLIAFPCEEGKVDGQDISKGVSLYVVCMTVNPFAAQMNPQNANASDVEIVLWCQYRQNSTTNSYGTPKEDCVTKSSHSHQQFHRYYCFCVPMFFLICIHQQTLWTIYTKGLMLIDVLMSSQWHLTIRNFRSITHNDLLDMLISIVAKELKPQGYLHHMAL